jgi:hypothetical protein
MKSLSHIPARRRLFRFGIAVAAAVAGSLAAVPALAGDTPQTMVDWNRLAPMMASTQEMLQHGSSSGASESAASLPWVGAEPRVSLVARDWAGSRGLWGSLVATDELRPARSNRMVVSRLRLAQGRVVPFAQLGAGQWRVDPTVMPLLPREQELAAQGGFGFELRLSSATAVAAEADWTLLLPTSDGDVIAETHPAFWGACVAMQTRF